MLFALVFLVFGFNHLTKANAMAGAVPGYLPGGVFWVYLTGLAFILAALAIIIGKKARLAGYLLCVMLLLFVLLIHVPAYMHAPDEAGKMMPMISILKDTGLAAGALFIGSKSS